MQSIKISFYFYEYSRDLQLLEKMAPFPPPLLLVFFFNFEVAFADVLSYSLLVSVGAMI